MIHVSDRQKLIDIAFQLVLTSTSNEWFKDKSQEEIANWVSEQYRACGFDTVPMGASWGVLKDEPNTR